MTTPILATVQLGAVGGLPEDTVDNDWSFLAADASETTLSGIASSLTNFYIVAGGVTGLAVGEYISDHISRAANACAIKFYDLSGHLDGSPHGSPVYTETFTMLDKASYANYPAEVAAAVSFMATGWELVPETASNPSPPPAVIRPRARYRGRVFLGPLIALAAGTSAKNEPIPAANFIATVGQALDAFMDERGGDFAVWSRADETLRLVAPDGVFWMDDAFDTQRRRGPAPTAKTFVWP